MRVRTFDEIDITKIKFPLITVYERPTDFPNSYIARLFTLNKPTEIYMQADTLAEIRAGLPLGMVMLEREPQDDPHIVEIWM
jgi:hypothetical protein